MIVFCHLLNDRSGSPTVLRATLEALNASENGVLFVGSQGRGVLEEANVPTRRYWYRRSTYRIATLFTFFASQLFLVLRLTLSRDIPREATVFANTLLPFGAMLWGRWTGRRVIVHVHEVSITPTLLRKLLTRIAAKSADTLIYVSQDHLARLPISGPATQVVFNPISPALFERGSQIGYSPRRTGAFEVTMLASLRRYKGVDEFMKLAEALQTRRDIKFSLVLNASSPEVEAFAARYPDANNVTLHPRTDDPTTFYATADLLLNLSRPDQWIETFGLTIVEGMAFGVPAIAPPVGGPAEIISHGTNGFLIDSQDIAALQAGVLAVADDAETATAMSNAARLRARDFTFEVYAKALRRVFNVPPKQPLGLGQ